MGSAVLGRQWLPHLLQLPQLKHLTLPVVWVTDTQQQAQELTTLRADLSAAAAARDSSTAASRGWASPLVTLQLLLVPACLKGGLEVLQPSSTAGDAHCIIFRPKLLQQLLQALLPELPQLQRLHLYVLGGIADWARLNEVATSVARESSGLHNLTIAEVTGDEVLRSDLCKYNPRMSMCVPVCHNQCVWHLHARSNAEIYTAGKHLRSCSSAATCVCWLALVKPSQLHALVRLALRQRLHGNVM
jgi:hypothetical protein